VESAGVCFERCTQFGKIPDFARFTVPLRSAAMNDTVYPPTTELGSSQVTQEEISRRAQQLWETLGRPADRDVEIWLRAERELRSAAPVAAPIESSVPERIVKVDVSAQPPKATAQPRKRSSRAAAR